MDLPETLAAMHRVTFTWEQYDYLGYAAFWTPQKTTDWLRAWTGNKSLNGTQFLVFGADGSGGQIAIWLAHLRVALSEQPVVFFGSEGARAVVAQNLADFAWLLAGGIGPLEAVEYGAREGTAHPGFQAVARQHFPDSAKTPAQILDQAAAAFPGFSAYVDGLVQQAPQP